MKIDGVNIGHIWQTQKAYLNTWSLLEKQKLEEAFYIWSFPDGSAVKNLPANVGDGGWSLDQEDPLEEEMVTHSSNLAWKIPWTEESGGLQSMGSQRIGHTWAHTAHSQSRDVGKQLQVAGKDKMWLVKSRKSPFSAHEAHTRATWDKDEEEMVVARQLRILDGSHMCELYSKAPRSHWRHCMECRWDEMIWINPF